MEWQKTKMVGEHLIKMPPLPKDRTKIIGIDDKPEGAFWRRQTDYKDIWLNFVPYSTEMFTDATTWDDNTGELKSLNQEDSEYVDHIYKQEFHRRSFGVYFNNGGELTYLTNHHYNLLQWAKMPRHDGQGDYADFFEYQADVSYLIWAAEMSESILGLDLTKAKKTGITNFIWAGPYLNESTLFKNHNLGATNIDKPLVDKTFRDYFMYAYHGLPSPLKCQIKSDATMSGSIIFGNSFKTAKGKRRTISDPANELNTSVFCVAPAPKAFDIAVMNKIWFDEFPKLKGSPEEIWRTNKEAIKIMGKKNGIALLTSYTPEEDTKAFLEARKIYFDSELKTVRDWSRNQTKTGLIAYHIPAYASWWGCFNKQGKCDEKRAWDEILFERRKCGDNKRALQAITRQYATTAKEAWMPAGAGTTFDNTLLADLLTDIEAFPGNQYEDGKLEFENKLWEVGKKDKRPKGVFGPVEWIPVSRQEKEQGTEGRMRMFEKLASNQKNIPLKLGRDEYKNLKAPERFNFVGGVDPTQYAAGSEVIEGSKNASYTMNMPDELIDAHYKRIASKIIFSEYYYRPENPNEFYEDLVKEIIYFGKLVIVEANVPHVATMLIEEGLGRYMLVRSKETGAICQWKPNMEYQLIRTTGANGNREIMETMVRLIKSWLQPGNIEDGDKDYGRTLKSERLIAGSNQLMEFNPEDTKKSDLVMAWGYCLLCLETYLSILLAPTDREEQEIYKAAVNAIRWWQEKKANTIPVR